MLETFRKFFAFCNEENRGRFYRSLVIGVLESIFVALKVPAIGLCLMDMLSGNIGSRTMWGSFGIMLLSILGQAACKYFSTMLQTRGGYMTGAGKRIEIAEHMRYMPMGYFNANSLGQITSVATNVMQNLEGVATRVVMMVTKGLMVTGVMTFVILLFDWRLGLVCIVGILVFALANHLLQAAGERLAPKKISSDAKQVEKVLEYIQGIAEVKAYRIVGKMHKKLESAIDENVKINTDMELSFIPWMTVQSFAADLISVAIAVFSLYFYCNGSMTLLNCMMMLICSFLISEGLKSAGSYSALMRVVDLSVNQANAILQTPTMDIDGEDISPKSHTLEAKHISFAYEERKVIDDISLVIPEKTTTAIVGPSGGGKTTLVNLLSRFWDVDEGTVTLGGVDIRKYDMDSLMKNFSFVFQNVTLFADTVANNIRFGQPDAPMEAVIEAAKKAQCHDFIMSLPEGYETVIGEDGGTLSGGERQRISIARAMMKDSPIIILDEATANVDPENEKELMDAIDQLTREKTVIMIAHRLKTVQNADQILVVDNGKIVQKGTHGKLLKEEGIYRRFISERERAAGWKLA